MRFTILAIALAALTASAQIAPTPQLSTAEKVALQNLEKQKSEAQQTFMQAQQTEQQIEQDFAREHPGFHLSPVNFAVIKDAAPAKKK